MTINKIDGVWAETGDKESTLTDAKKTVGWVAGADPDRPSAKRLNYLQNRIDAKANEIIDRGPKALAVAATENDYVQNLFTPANAVDNTACDLNVFDLSSDLTGNIRDFCFAIIGGERKILIVDEDVGSGNHVSVFDIATGAWESGSGDLDANLPSGGGETWYALSICADATYCYVLFVDTNASPDDHQVQSFVLTNFAVNPNWPATGLALTSGSVAYDDEQAKIRNASDSKLVVTQPWVSVSSGTSAGLNIISKSDGTSDGTGAGNVGSVSNGQVSGVCSDGTTVFFPVELAATIKICGMTIASPGANGPSGIRWPWTVTASPSEFGGIACSGNIIVATWSDGTLLYSVHHTANGTIAEYSTGDVGKCYVLGQVCFDGKSFWSLGEREVNASGTTYLTHMFKLKGAERGGFFLSADPYIDSVADGELFTSAYLTADITQNNGGVVNNYEAGVVLSDGTDVWFCGGGGQELYKLTHTLLR
jgi:hypothetical protein